MNFISGENKGFRMKFDNGFAISVQWGTENYCEHRNLDIKSTAENPKEHNRWESRNAEIAVFNDKGIVPVGEHDDVIGWLTPNEVAIAIEIVSGYQGQTMTGLTGEKYIKDMFKKYSIK